MMISFNSQSIVTGMVVAGVCLAVIGLWIDVALRIVLAVELWEWQRRFRRPRARRWNRRDTPAE